MLITLIHSSSREQVYTPNTTILSEMLPKTNYYCRSCCIFACHFVDWLIYPIKLAHLTLFSLYYFFQPYAPIQCPQSTHNHSKIRAIPVGTKSNGNVVHLCCIQPKRQYVQISNIIDIFIKHPISDKSTLRVKGCIHMFGMVDTAFSYWRALIVC